MKVVGRCKIFCMGVLNRPEKGVSGDPNNYYPLSTRYVGIFGIIITYLAILTPLIFLPNFEILWAILRPDLGDLPDSASLITKILIENLEIYAMISMRSFRSFLILVILCCLKVNWGTFNRIQSLNIIWNRTMKMIWA